MFSICDSGGFGGTTANNKVQVLSIQDIATDYSSFSSQASINLIFVRAVNQN